MAQSNREIQANFQAGLAAGLTPGQAATTNTLGSYIVKQGDNLSTIASTAGTTPESILQANPDMSVPKTGMVINTPQYTQGEKNYTPVTVGSEAWRVQQQNKGMWTNNAAYGSTTTNPSGGNAGAVNNPNYQAGMQAYASSIQQQSIARPQGQGNPAAGYAFQPPRTPAYGGGYNPTVTNPNYRALNGAPINAGGTSVAPVQTSPNLNPQNAITGPQGASENASVSNILNTILAETGPNGRMATDYEMNLLKYYSAIKQGNQTASNTTTYGGGSSYRSYRGGGRGGGGSVKQSSAGYGYGQSTPAFGSGAGFGGLVNWRI